MDPASLALIRETWRQVMRAPDAFRGPGIVVVPRATRSATPPWATVITLEESTCLIASTDLAVRLDPAVAASLADPRAARLILGPELRVLGPAILAFADRTTFRAPAGGIATPTVAGAVELAQLGAGCDPAEVEESALGTWQRWVNVVVVDGQVVAGAGVEVWAPAIAHIGVLTRADQRGLGYARTAAAATVAQALAAGMVAQWRARRTLTASRRVAAALGFVELGSQVTYTVAGGERDG
jgi:hypothetical protein